MHLSDTAVVLDLVDPSVLRLLIFLWLNHFRLGGGQVLSFNWQFGVGSLYRTFTLGFTEPWMFDTPTSVGVEVFDTRQQYVYDLRQSGGTLRVGRRLKWPDDFFLHSGQN